MMKENVENKSPQLNQTGNKSTLFLLKEIKEFYLLLENFCFIYSLSEPSRSKRPGYKGKVQAEQKRWGPCFGLPEFIKIYYS